MVGEEVSAKGVYARCRKGRRTDQDPLSTRSRWSCASSRPAKSEANHISVPCPRERTRDEGPRSKKKNAPSNRPLSPEATHPSPSSSSSQTAQTRLRCTRPSRRVVVGRARGERQRQVRGSTVRSLYRVSRVSIPRERRQKLGLEENKPVLNRNSSSPMRSLRETEKPGRMSIHNPASDPRESKHEWTKTKRTLSISRLSNS